MTQPKSMRVRQADLQEAIHVIHKDKQEDRVVEVFDESLAFCMSGEEDERTDKQGNPQRDGFPILWDLVDGEGNLVEEAKLRDEACAYTEMRGKRRAYFIKSNNQGRFLNPKGMYDEMRHTKILKHAGKAEWNFVEVPPRIFDLYLKFLQTKNVAWLTTAQREAF